MTRRTLISVAAACALSAGVAGGAAAMPIDDPTPQSVGAEEIGLFEQRSTTPPSQGVSAREVALFQQRAHRTAVDWDASSPGRKALDREYELAGYVRVPAGTTAPAWFDALLTRSDALNRTSGLGAYAKLQH
jgi:hypothetical protein